MTPEFTSQQTVKVLRVWVLGFIFTRRPPKCPPNTPLTHNIPLLTGKFWGHFTGPCADLPGLTRTHSPTSDEEDGAIPVSRYSAGALLLHRALPPPTPNMTARRPLVGVSTGERHAPSLTRSPLACSPPYLSPLN